MRLALGGLSALLVVGATSPARAQAVVAEPREPAPLAPATDGDVLEVERVHRESIATRRALADAILIVGIGSAAGGAALLVTDAEDQAFRFAGLNTAIFGAVNAIVALLALRGIAKEEDAWESPEASGTRRTPGGLARARVHAALDERREATSHAINLGLDGAYLGVAGTAILASRLGVEHPSRWLGSGIAIGVQALFLVGVDFIGLRRAAGYHRTFVDGLAPSVAVLPSAAGAEVRLSAGGVF